MEFTKREILFSVNILSVMIGIGLWISNPIITNVTQKADKIVSSTQARDSAMFDYIRRTDVGDFIAEGTLTVNNPVHIDDIEGYYGKIEKVTEEYTQHTRTVTTVDSKGVPHSHIETYWEWDVKKREKWAADSANFLGHNFSLEDIKFRFSTTHNVTINAPSKIFHTDTRYVYYTAPTSYDGTLVGTIAGKAYADTKFRTGGTIDKAIEKAYSRIHSVPIGFWIIWLLLSLGIIVLFASFENRWLY